LREEDHMEAKLTIPIQEHYKTMTRDELVLKCMELSTQLQEQISIPKIVAFGSIIGILAGVMFILLFS
jgi:hypothetical protein